MGRVRAEGMRRGVMDVLEVWEGWQIGSVGLDVEGLRKVFGKGIGEKESVINADGLERARVKALDKDKLEVERLILEKKLEDERIIRERERFEKKMFKPITSFEPVEISANYPDPTPIIPRKREFESSDEEEDLLKKIKPTLQKRLIKKQPFLMKSSVPFLDPIKVALNMKKSVFKAPLQPLPVLPVVEKDLVDPVVEIDDSVLFEPDPLIDGLPFSEDEIDDSWGEPPCITEEEQEPTAIRDAIIETEEEQRISNEPKIIEINDIVMVKSPIKKIPNPEDDDSDDMFT